MSQPKPHPIAQILRDALVIGASPVERDGSLIPDGRTDPNFDLLEVRLGLLPISGSMPVGFEEKTREILPVEVSTCTFEKCTIECVEEGKFNTKNTKGIRVTLEYRQNCQITLSLLATSPGDSFPDTPHNMRITERLDYLFRGFPNGPPSSEEDGKLCVCLDGVWCTVDLSINYSEEYLLERKQKKEEKRLAAQVEQLRIEEEQQRIEAERLVVQKQREAIAEAKKLKMEETVRMQEQECLSKANAAGYATWEEYQQKLLDEKKAKQDELGRQKALEELARKKRCAAEAELRRREKEARAAEEFNRSVWAGKKGASPPRNSDSL
jgi:hypothetical protein